MVSMLHAQVLARFIVESRAVSRRYVPSISTSIRKPPCVPTYIPT